MVDPFVSYLLLENSQVELLSLLLELLSLYYLPLLPPLKVMLKLVV